MMLATLAEPFDSGGLGTPPLHWTGHPDGPPRRLRIVPAATLASRQVPLRRWHVDGMIPAGTVTSLYGDGGTGKSLVALQLAVSTTVGRPWIGLPVEAGGCLMLTAEDDLDEVHRRLADVCHADQIDIADLDGLAIVPLAGEDAVLAAPERNGILKATALFAAVEDTVDQLRPRLIILDTLADLYGGNEVDRAQVRQFIGMLRGIAIRFDTAVLLLAHPSLAGISSGTGSSGSTAWNASVRSRLYMRRVTSRDGDRIIEEDPDLRTLDTVKTNYGRTGTSLTLKWERGRFVPHGASMGGSLNAMASQNRVDRVFRDLVAAYNAEGRSVSSTPSRNYAPTVFAIDPRSEKAGKKGLEAAMNRLFASGAIRTEETGSPARRRSRIVLALAEQNEAV